MQSGMNRYGLISGALLALATIVSAAGGGVGGGAPPASSATVRLPREPLLVPRRGNFTLRLEGPPPPICLYS
jgi:hypothetical protein